MARAIIPLFPLGSVLYPGLALPLHIFEERYRLLVSHLSDGESDIERSFGVVAIRAGHEVGEASVSTLHEIGTTAVLRRVTPYPDGRSDIVTTGSRRFRLHAVDDSMPYLRAEVSWVADEVGDPVEVSGVADDVRRRFRGYQTLLGSGPQASETHDGEDETELPDDPTVLSYLVSAAMLLDLGDRQGLLAAPTTQARLARLSSLLAREDALIRLLQAVPATDMVRTTTVLN